MEVETCTRARLIWNVSKRDGRSTWGTALVGPRKESGAKRWFSVAAGLTLLPGSVARLPPSHAGALAI
jgi:hypothetical protein